MWACWLDSMITSEATRKGISWSCCTRWAAMGPRTSSATLMRSVSSSQLVTPTNSNNCSAAEIGNAYDNTIVYTDHFLARVVELLSDYDDRFETAMLYVSDHGESLGESGVYLHGLPYWIAPYTQIKVPLIMWFGENYTDVDHDAVARLRDVELSHDNVFQTLLGLFEVNTELYRPDKDILQLARDLPGK